MAAQTTPAREAKTRSKARLEPPAPYRVLMHNDDYTSMEFVVEILQSLFHKQRSEADQIMLNIHYQGMATCGVYPFEIAETKVAQVHSSARAEGFPLRCTLDET